MRTLRNWLPVLLLPLLAGCFPGIYAEQPLGEAFVFKPEDKVEQLNGSWLGREGRLVTLSVIDVEKGVVFAFRAHSCDPVPPVPAEEALQLRRIPGATAHEPDHLFFPMAGSVDALGRFTPTQKPPFRYQQLLLFLGPEVLFYRVAEDRIKALVEQGALPGRIDNGYVVVGRLGPEHRKVLLGGERAPVHWQSPEAVLVKLPPELDPCGTGEHGR